MFRANRGRIIGISLTIFIIYFLFSSSTDTEFRRRTEDGIARKHGVLRGDLSDEALLEQTNKKLEDILANKNAHEAPPAKAPDAIKSKGTAAEDQAAEPTEDVSVAGRKKMSRPKDSSPPKYPVDDQKSLSEEKGKAGNPGKDFAREKLQEYLKKPVVIFSKSYCPHSKRAKLLLQEMYSIVPAPLVVELDQLNERVPIPHTTKTTEGEDDAGEVEAPTLGRELQDLLGEVTGRRTVPNIMVGMHSIGGNDLIWAMHEDGTLADEIKKLGGRRITSVEMKKDGV